MPGSGKSLLASLFVERGVKAVSMGDVVRDMYSREGREGESLMDYAKRIRAERGEDVVARATLERIKGERLAVVDGVRSLKEVEVFSNVGDVVIIAVHSSPKLRYSRMTERGRRDDAKSLEELRRRDMEEIRLGIGGVIALADFVVVNDGTVEDFRRSSERIVKVLLDVEGSGRSRG
jgi:dephospho-CoA kinase